MGDWDRRVRSDLVFSDLANREVSRTIIAGWCTSRFLLWAPDLLIRTVKLDLPVKEAQVQL